MFSGKSTAQRRFTKPQLWRDWRVKGVIGRW